MNDRVKPDAETALRNLRTVLNVEDYAENVHPMAQSYCKWLFDEPMDEYDLSELQNAFSAISKASEG